MSSAKILTQGWNNVLSAALGVPTLIYASIFLGSNVISDFWGFMGMFALGAVY